MKNTALFFLHKVAKDNPDNPVAKAIYNKFNNDTSYSDENNWSLLEIELGEEAELGEIDYFKDVRNHDYRFRNVYLKAFRKFPEDRKHGISFCNDKDGSTEPQSTLLQGGNGTGKTSIFSAIEYLFTDNISAANKQGYDKENVKSYIPFNHGPYENVEVCVSTNYGLFKLENGIKQQDSLLSLCLLPFFCSEYDIDKLIKEGLNNFIYEQMGYGFTKKIIKKLKDEISYASTHHEEQESTHDTNKSRSEELDRIIGTCQGLKTFFLKLNTVLHGQKDSVEKIKKIKTELSKEYVKSDKPFKSNDKKRLGIKNLDNEKKLLEDIVGVNDFTPRYSQLANLVRTEKNENKGEISPIISDSQSNTVRVGEELRELNFTRKTLLDLINNILKEEKTLDFDNCIIEFENYLGNLKKVKEGLDKRLKEQEIFTRYNNNKECYDIYLEKLKAEVYGTLERITEVFQGFVEEITGLFLMEDEDLEFVFNNTKDDKKQGEFIMNLYFHPDSNDKNKGTSFLPEEYLNTFRFKLFCMSLKVAIAFIIKKFYGINFPLVIDDIFYSSDFAHRNMVNGYFRKLFEKHQELFPHEELQVIFFSHDELIIESALRGISNRTDSVAPQTLFDYHEATKEDDMKDGEGVSAITIFRKISESYTI